MPETDALFDLPESRATLPPAPEGWPQQPVAKVLLETPVPHLDRYFDYLIPQELDTAAKPGVRVKVRFGHQQLFGWLIQRTDTIDTVARLTRLQKVVSVMPVLEPKVLELAQLIAQDYGSITADVLRAVIPRRVAGVERDIAQQLDDDTVPLPPVIEAPPAAPVDETTGPTFAWDLLDGAEQLFTPGHPGHYALTLASAHASWDAMGVLADAAQRLAALQQASLVIVPDQKHLSRLQRQLEERVGTRGFALLSGDQGNTSRYRSFLQILNGQHRIVVGTRSAIWAPLAHIDMIMVWEPTSDHLIEPRTPYFHVHAVARRRATQHGSRLVLASTSRAIDVQHLVATGELTQIGADRDIRKALAPRVVATSDSFHAERDPLAQIARIPHMAYRAARDALDGKHGDPGPVLVQVARAGFIPGLFCARCGESARCTHCAGPLGYTDRLAVQRHEATCRWCGIKERSFSCHNCQGNQLRAGARGVHRTADELGRAFPMTPIMSSSADHLLVTVADQPAIVIATPGAEPVAPKGYAAALLLDGDAQLQREGLNVPEEVLGHWMRAAKLVRPAGDGGVVVVTAQYDDAVAALVQMNPIAWADRQLGQRQQLGLPPAMRVAEILGPIDELHKMMRGTPLPYQADESPWIGPVGIDEQSYRALLFFPQHVADRVITALKTTRAQLSARGESTAVRLRIDPTDVL
ncbi:MAG: primosomal protein N' [Micrococcaceae bacterium]|nr:primosomal protein N' [Micrococcaceae bacterium]